MWRSLHLYSNILRISLHHRVSDGPRDTRFNPRIYKCINGKSVSSCTTLKSYHVVFTTGSGELLTASGGAWYGGLRKCAPFFPALDKAISGKVSVNRLLAVQSIQLSLLKIAKYIQLIAERMGN